jgi:hypothetical protein
VISDEAYLTELTAKLNTDILLMHFHSVEISLLEIGLHEPLEPTTQKHTFLHLTQLSSCLAATRSFFDTWFLLPSSAYINLSIVAWAQIANAVMAVSKLILLDHDGWDLEHAREVADFSNTLDRIASLIEQNTKVVFAGNGNKGADAENAFMMYAKRLRWVRDWYVARIEAEKEEKGKEIVELAMSGEETGMMTDFMNVDDVFWQDFVGEWKFADAASGG